VNTFDFDDDDDDDGLQSIRWCWLLVHKEVVRINNFKIDLKSRTPTNSKLSNWNSIEGLWWWHNMPSPSPLISLFYQNIK
jgi:hypothetical protein